METAEKTLEQITAEIVNQAIQCARQNDKWRKPYAAIIAPDGSREFIDSVGRFRTPLEAQDARERADLLAKITCLPIGAIVETRDARECPHRTEYRNCWTRTEDGWKHERITGRNKYGH